MYAGKVGLTNEIFQLNQTAPISPLGQSALNIGLNQFRDTCGNRFVQQYITGAGLYFIVKFEFASTEQKTKFDSSVSGSYGAASLSAAASKAVSDNHITGSVSVRAMQIGGDAKQLLGIVGSDGSGQAPVKVCSLSDITACSNLLTSLLKYTASVPAQIQQVGAQNQILGYVLQDYGVALIPQPLPSILTLELVTARNDLLNMLESQSADLDRANALMLAFGASMNAADYAALDRLIIDLTFNIPKIQAAGLACWELPSDCITKKTELGWLLRPLNRASLTMQLIIPAGYFSKGDAYAYYASGNGTYCTVVDTLEDKQGSSAALQAILPHLYTTIYPHGVKYRGLLPIEKEVLRTMSFLGNCARPTNEIYANTGGHPYECTTTWFTPSGTFAARFIANIYKGSLNCNSPAYTKYCAADSAHDVTNVLHCM